MERVPYMMESFTMKRFVLAASIFAFAACAPGDDMDTTDTAAPSTPPAAVDTTADTTTRTDTTDTTATKM